MENILLFGMDCDSMNNPAHAKGMLWTYLIVGSMALVLLVSTLAPQVRSWYHPHRIGPQHREKYGLIMRFKKDKVLIALSDSPAGGMEFRWFMQDGLGMKFKRGDWFTVQADLSLKECTQSVKKSLAITQENSGW